MDPDKRNNNILHKLIVLNQLACKALFFIILP